MKKYKYPIVKVIELESGRNYADDYSVSDDETDEQWGRKREGDFGNKKGVGGKLWEDIN